MVKMDDVAKHPLVWGSHFLTSSAALGAFVVALEGEASVAPSLRVVSAFRRSLCLESIWLSLYCFCTPNLKGGAMSEPSIVSAVALEWIVLTLRSLCNLFALPKTSAFLGDLVPSSVFWLASWPSLAFASPAVGLYSVASAVSYPSAYSSFRAFCTSAFAVLAASAL